MDVRLTANFERNLDEIEHFLLDIGASGAFDGLLDELQQQVVPTLARFPLLGSPFLSRPAESAEALAAQESLRAKAGTADLRQYVLAHYLLLYAVQGQVVYLLSIRHQRQLSFDVDALGI